MLPDVEEPRRLALRPDAARIATLAHDAEAPAPARKDHNMLWT